MDSDIKEDLSKWTPLLEKLVEKGIIEVNGESADWNVKGISKAFLLEIFQGMLYLQNHPVLGPKYAKKTMGDPQGFNWIIAYSINLVLRTYIPECFSEYNKCCHLIYSVLETQKQEIMGRQMAADLLKEGLYEW